jgi:hypothetical protein
MKYFPIALVLMLACAPDFHAADPPTKKTMLGKLPVSKVLFLGNSITLHDPAPAIGWTGNWGMAASSEEKDYVHLLTSELTKAAGAKPEIKVRNIADFERAFDGFDIETKFKGELDFQADLVIVAIGENVPELVDSELQEKYSIAFGRLLTSLRAHGQPNIFVRSCFWPNTVKDDIMRKSAEGETIAFVDIAKLGLDETNAAKAERQIEHAGVAGHPGDKGMRAIADALFAAILAKSKPN